MAATQKQLEDLISNSLASPAQVAAAKAKLEQLTAPTPAEATAEATTEAVAPAPVPASGPDMADNQLGRMKRYLYFDTMRTAEPDNPAYTDEAEAFEDLHFPHRAEERAKERQDHLDAVAKSHAKLKNLHAVCSVLSKRLFPLDHARGLDQTSHLVDRVLNNCWPSEYGLCPDGTAVVPPVVPAKPIPMTPEQLAIDAAEVTAKKAAAKADIEHREQKRQEDMARDSEDWNKLMGLPPGFRA